jgi:hypothetical protein
LAYLNRAAINMSVQVSLLYADFDSFGTYVEVVYLDHMEPYLFLLNREDGVE